MANFVTTQDHYNRRHEEESLDQPDWTFNTSDDIFNQALVNTHNHSDLVKGKTDYPSHFILPSVSNMASNRKFSYASVKEEEDIPQSFNSSLSSKDFEEIEWIAAPCSQACRTKGLCSSHSGGSHEEYVQIRLEGYARSNPDKLHKILDELEKRRKCPQLPSHARLSSSIKSIRTWLRPTRLTEYEPADEEAVFLSESDEEEDVMQTIQLVPAPQQNNLEQLPEEILAQIFGYTTMDRTADPYIMPRVDLPSVLLTSKSLRIPATRVMYNHVSFSKSRAFFKFCRSLAEDESLGQYVRCLDFSHYSSIGFGRTRTVANQTPYLTPITLKACLDKLPNLKAFLVHEHIDDELSLDVLSTLFMMPHLNALDLCACASKSFSEAMSKLCESFPEGATTSIKRLSLHECSTLQEPVFEAILPQMTNLTHLDLAHTLVSDKALLSIPHTARITHLNLERCTRLTGGAVVEFITKHPAVKDSIIYLNLMSDAARHRLLAESEVSALLAGLPSSIKSLNLGGARINSYHVPALQRLSTHVEELGLRSANLSLGTDIAQLLNSTKQPAGYRSQIRYLDLTDIRSVNQMSLCYSPEAITTSSTMPLEVIEVGSSLLDEIQRRSKNIKNPEWSTSELGRRGWYVRQPRSEEGIVLDDGAREWKMGAKWWGMKKIPVFEQDVGGMYGYFMFKRS